MSAVHWQRFEGFAICVAIIAAMVAIDLAWWWVFALFLLFDLSMAGYVRGPRLGAFLYNAVHNYGVPAVLGAVALVTDAQWLGVIAFAWAFHVGADRALGYGLKHDDGFEHTHLGLIGRTRRGATPTS